MKNPLLQIIAVLILTLSASIAGLSDVDISVTRIKLDEQKSRNSGMATTTQVKQVAYKVTVQNKTFKTIPELQIKYMIFYADAPELGSKDSSEEKFEKGTETVTNLEGNRSVTFETKPVKLVKQSLDGGWYFADGASSRNTDRVAGVWFRAYVQDKIVGEYINPSTISRRQQWKE